MRVGKRVAVSCSVPAICAVAVCLAMAAAGCGSERGDGSPSSSASPPVHSAARAAMHLTDLRTAHAETSRPLRDARPEPGTVPPAVHPAMHRSSPAADLSPAVAPFDPALQTSRSVFAMPAALEDFLGQGNTTSPGIVTGVPPDTNGAVGPHHYVQTVNGGIGVWDKQGNVVMAPKLLNALWAGYTGTNPGNACATRNDGDPIVLYDRLADRWFVSQFSLPNYPAKPAFQCVAVSQTGDPTGAYNLYDFEYQAGLDDYPKFGVWPDAYYATFNMFSSSFLGADLCAYDRAAMLQGAPATQQCFQQSNSVFSVLPASADGKVPPPRGEPGIFAALGTDSTGGYNDTLSLWTLHVDWTAPANSRLTGPTQLPVASYTGTCNYAKKYCVPEPSSGKSVDSLGDRLMFRLAYRNFGTYESLTVNHSIEANGASGVRWYEVRSLASSPAIAQQGTWAPNDGDWRWMGSLAQDQAADLAVGYSISNGTSLDPSIAWTGHLPSDGTGVMGQGETLVDTGTGVEKYFRWGDYSAMTVDPVDDCTFWYTTELYDTSGTNTWDTYVASFKFPRCAASDFSIGVAPASQGVVPGGAAVYTVTTASTVGTAETIALTVEDLPAGVTGSFNPASVTAGSSSVLTLSAASGAPTGSPQTFMVIGTAASAVEVATAQAQVIGSTCVPLTSCPAPEDCGTIPNGCGGMVSCGPGCAAPQTCGGGGVPNVCGQCTPITSCPAPDQCGTIPDGCGGIVACGPGCTTPQTCGGGGVPNVCGCTPVTACPVNDVCGTIDDGCGGTVSCGTCADDETCSGNRCLPIDGGSVGDDGGGDGGGVSDGGGTGDGGSVGDGGSDGASGSDGGSDGGVDSGMSSSGADSGGSSGSVDSGAPAPDSGSGIDASEPADGSGGGDAAEEAEGGAGAPVGSSGGCGCKVAQARETGAPPALLAFGVLALVGGRRSRRRRP